MRRAVGCCCVRSGLAFLAARFLPGERGRQLTEISTVPINLGTAASTMASTTESSQNAKAMPKAQRLQNRLKFGRSEAEIHAEI